MAEIPAVNDDYFGVCSTCLKAAGCNIGHTNWMYCKEHGVKWRVGENVFSEWRDETEQQWFANYELLKDFRVIEPHSSWLNDPANASAQPCSCERCIASVLAAISMAAKAD